MVYGRYDYSSMDVDGISNDNWGGPSCTPWFGADVCLGTTEDVANLVFFGGQRALHLWVVKTWRQKNACKHMFIQGGAPPVINGL